MKTSLFRRVFYLTLRGRTRVNRTLRARRLFYVGRLDTWVFRVYYIFVARDSVVYSTIS
jgi:hypothetical protein